MLSKQKGSGDPKIVSPDGKTGKQSVPKTLVKYTNP
jgi:hypothetical protein